MIWLAYCYGVFYVGDINKEISKQLYQPTTKYEITYRLQRLFLLTMDSNTQQLRPKSFRGGGKRHVLGARIFCGRQKFI